MTMTATVTACDHCKGKATHVGWAFPAGGSFPVVGCEPCLKGLAQDMDVRVAPIKAREVHAEDCPECRQGKHENCAGFAFDDGDNEVECPCAQGGHL